MTFGEILKSAQAKRLNKVPKVTGNFISSLETNRIACHNHTIVMRKISTGQLVTICYDYDRVYIIKNDTDNMYLANLTTNSSVINDPDAQSAITELVKYMLPCRQKGEK